MSSCWKAGIRSGSGSRNDKTQYDRDTCQFVLMNEDVFFMPFLKGGASMYFTEGRLRAYERIMQEKPKHDHEFSAKPVRDERSEERRVG